MIIFSRRPSSWLLVAILCSCAGDAPPDPPPAPAANLYARVQLGGAGLSITSIGPRGMPTSFATPGSTPLRYQLLDATGAVVTSGELTDPRLAHFEAFDGAGPHWLAASVGYGAATIALPARAGTLVVSEPTPAGGSRELGRTAYDPSAPRPAPRLARANDVLATVKLVDHGPAAGHLNLAILAEGYTVGELGRFDQSVDRFVAELQAIDGFAQHWSQINIWRFDVRSNQSGAGAGGIAKDTAFATAYDTAGIHRLLAMESQDARDAARRLRESVQADAAIVMVNSVDYGGSGDGTNVESVIYAGDAGDGRGVASIAGHELGHSIWKLADEYVDTGLCDPANPPGAAPNFALSSARASLPWANLVATGTPLPTTSDDPDVVGAFEGAAYCATGRFRAQHDCRMRSLDHGYCEVCLGQIDDYFQRLAGTTGTSTGPTCGNGVCEAGETCASCAQDCSATCAAPPASPTNLSPDHGVSAGSPVTLSWSGVPGATSYWVVLGHFDANGTWNQDAFWNNGGATFETFADDPGASYGFAVIACSVAACGEWSGWASFAGG